MMRLRMFVADDLDIRLVLPCVSWRGRALYILFMLGGELAGLAIRVSRVAIIQRGVRT